jgi:hypothetical protein
MIEWFYMHDRLPDAKDEDQMLLYTTRGPQLAEFYEGEWHSMLGGDLYGTAIDGVVLAFCEINKPEGI